MVKIVFLGLNKIGKRIYEWLMDRDDATVLALLTEESQLDVVGSLDPSLLISAGFRHHIPSEILDIAEYGSVNFHKAYLPHNRGANPNVWSIIDASPAGVTLHYMTADMDAGPIIDRRQVSVHPDDTGLSLYERLEREQFKQFTDCWPAIRDNDVDAVEQDTEEGSYHYKEDFVDLWHIESNETLQAGEFLDRLRALTFPPFKNAYFEEDGNRYYVDVSITHEDDIEEPPGRMIPTYSEDEIP